LLGDVHHQAEVGEDHLVAGAGGLGFGFLFLVKRDLPLAEKLSGSGGVLDGITQLALFVGRQQRGCIDLLEIVLES